MPFASEKVPKNPSLIFIGSIHSDGTPNSFNFKIDHSLFVKFLPRETLYSVIPGLLRIHILLHIPLWYSSEAVLYLCSRFVWEPPNTYIASTFVPEGRGLVSISSSSIKCFRSDLKGLELVLFSHMAEKRKTKRVPNEMISRDFVVKDTIFHLDTDLHR